MESEIRSSRDFVQMRAEMQIAQVLYTHTHTHTHHIYCIYCICHICTYISRRREISCRFARKCKSLRCDRGGRVHAQRGSAADVRALLVQKHEKRTKSDTSGAAHVRK